jgi:hypothetical protein
VGEQEHAICNDEERFQKWRRRYPKHELTLAWKKATQTNDVLSRAGYLDDVLETWCDVFGTPK